MTLRPSRLKIGDTIGIIAPSGPVTQSEIKPSIELLSDRGYKVLSSPNLYLKQDYLAGDDDARLSDLHLMFRDKNIKAIICARGGYGTTRLLDKVDYNLIRKNPKIFVGFSDITALLFAIYKETGLITFHGPIIKGLSGSKINNLDNLFRVVSSEDPFQVSLANGIAIKEGSAVGRIFGGNLSLISSLIGTDFIPFLRGSILFIEESDEPLYRIDRMLTQLRLSGLLGGLAGLIAGEFKDCGDEKGIYKLLNDKTYDFDFPVVTGLPVGHGIKNITIPIGLQVEINTGDMSLYIPNPCSTM